MMSRRRNTLRLSGFDYSLPGAYFITICACGRQHLFGCMVQGEFVPNRLGQLILEMWQRQTQYFVVLILDEFCLMPNHFHAVVVLADTKHIDGRDRKPTSIPRLMQAFKAQAALEAVRDGLLKSGKDLWQHGYYDHIVRNEESLTRIREYVRNNPAQWELDSENEQRTGLNLFYAWLEAEGKQWRIEQRADGQQ